MERRRVGARVTGLVVVATIGLLLLNSYAAGSSEPTFESGVGTAPKEALGLAVGAASSYLCRAGSLTSVEQEGAVSLADLQKLQPRTPGLDAATAALSADTVVDAAVIGGQCSYGDEGRVATRGYVLFTADGSVIYYRLWDQGSTPDLDAPFGSEVDDAIAS
jgi:hypothetical protein